MPVRGRSERSVALHVIPVEEEQIPRERHLRSVGAPDRREATVISIDSARSYRQHDYSPRQVREPAMAAKWAVGLSVVMFLAALTSGQA
jgi:hypothetical protein